MKTIHSDIINSNLVYVLFFKAIPTIRYTEEKLDYNNPNLVNVTHRCSKIISN